jgi:hypothetical protein
MKPTLVFFQCYGSGSESVGSECFLGLLDLDPLVRGMDPDPDPSIILLSSSKNSKTNLDSYCFVTSFGLFIFEK